MHISLETQMLLTRYVLLQGFYVLLQESLQRSGLIGAGVTKFIHDFLLILVRLFFYFNLDSSGFTVCFRFEYGLVWFCCNASWALIYWMTTIDEIYSTSFCFPLCGREKNYKSLLVSFKQNTSYYIFVHTYISNDYQKEKSNA